MEIRGGERNAASVILIPKIQRTMNTAVWVLVPTLLSLCDISVSLKSENTSPRVVTPLGTIEGYHKISHNGRKYEAYEGIPYADPPVGESRFGVARSVSPWEGVLMAKRIAPLCMQYRPTGPDPANHVKGSEDCLYMNVYSAIPADDKIHPKSNGTRNNLLPVIFFIHGGAFLIGNSTAYGPKYLLDNDITLVTFHYRLGPLGFLSTEDEIVPGNMGLKDQVIALRWVKDNIESFGGDPSRITIFGQSAGAGSVHYHYLTNLTAGLFQRGMSASGTALGCWAQTENSLQKAKKLSSIVGCSSDDVQSMINCLRTRPGHQIVQAVGEFGSWRGHIGVPFGPVIEKGAGPFTFIDRSPMEIISAGQAHDVPWITGVASHEGLVATAPLISNELLVEELNDEWETIAPPLLDFDGTIPKSEQPEVARLIRDHYLGESPIRRLNISQAIQLVGDRLFGYSGEKAARLQARVNQSPVYFYYFSYRGVQSLSEILSGSNEDFGVSHKDDILYVFETSRDPTTTPRDREIQKKLIRLWVSFATNGTPDVGVEWQALNRFTTDELNYLHIAGPDEITMRNSNNFAQKNFWHSIDLDENCVAEHEV